MERTSTIAIIKKNNYIDKTMFDYTKFRIKIVRHHYYGDDDKLRGQDLYDVYLNVGILPPIFNRWVINRKGITADNLKFYMQYILHDFKELTIRY